MERQGGLVTDRVGERVAAHIAGLILHCAESVEGILVGAVNRGAGQAEEECVGQRHAHLLAQVAFLGSVSFVDHDNDIITGIQFAINLAELENGGDQDLAHITTEEFDQLFFG